MKRQKDPLSLLNIFIFVFFVLLCVYLITTIGKMQRKNAVLIEELNQQNRTKTYHSKNLDFSVLVPDYFTIEDSFNSVNLSGHNGIRIARNGTLNPGIESFMNSLEKLNKLKFEERKKMTINGYDAVLTSLKRNYPKDSTVMAYYIYADDWVFIISTDNPELYDELEQVAKSFKYTP